jgi:glucose-6-phosphate isomerase
MIEYRNLNETRAFAGLKNMRMKGELKNILSAERVGACHVPMAAGLSYHYAAKQVDQAILSKLQELADEQQLVEKYRTLLDGEPMNTGEKRMVLHQLARGRLGKDVTHEGRSLAGFYAAEQKRIDVFADKVHRGELRGSTGKQFTTVVQIGIGGSDLGPRALYLALQNHCRASGAAQKLQARFISNVDPDDADEVLGGLDPETTLFIVVSKSGTTQETLTNQALVLERMRAAGRKGLDPRKHLIAVTSQTSPMAKSGEYLEAFFIDDFIGGRYSATSAVGGAVLSLAFGGPVMAGILAGAHAADRTALEPDLTRNASLLDALIGVYERNVLGYPVTAVLPYSQALVRFPAHLQQLDMESNGKRVNRLGRPLDYQTGPVIFGEPGTNGQHSFYQLLHQGTDVIPLQFIGFKRSQAGRDIQFEGSTSQAKLKANLAAQIAAFAQGRSHAEPNKDFPGGRPSSLILGDSLDPAALGALLAHFENKVMFQGFAWNLNSFDQEGVQLGKILASELLGGRSANPALRAYAGLLGL